MRRALAQSSRRNALLAWVPERALGVLASNDVKSGIQSALDQASPTMDAQTRDSLQQFGLLGDKGVIAHLTGDLALEVEAPAAKKIGGAVLIGTSDASGMQAFLTRLGTLAELGNLGSGPGGSSSALSVQKSTYRGVSITSFPISGLVSPDLVPSIAVTQGAGIVASSPAEVRSLIDAHLAGTTIARAHNFAAVAAATFADPQSFLYVDVTATTDAILSYVPAADRRTYDTARTNLAPVKAFMVASHQQPDRLSERVFILIPS
jgi:hypothetical protein